MAVAVLLLLLFACLPWSPGRAGGESQAGFAGIEFYGSSQITRRELEQALGLKPGARLAQIARAVDRLDRKLTGRRLQATVEIVEGSPQEIFVAVDLPDGQGAAAPTRRLRSPRHVAVSSEKPFLLLGELEARLEKLRCEGRPWSETMRSGLKYYSDEPANQVVEQMTQMVPFMRDELIAVTESDPDPARRKQAIDLLNWAGSIPDTTRRLIPSLDDADRDVRAAAARYMFSRFELLPDDFPYDSLTDSFSRMLMRPSHQDRSKALYCLRALAGQHPELLARVAALDGERIKTIYDLTAIPSIKSVCGQLLALTANPPRPRRPARAGSGGPPDAGF